MSGSRYTHNDQLNVALLRSLQNPLFGHSERNQKFWLDTLYVSG